MSGDLFVYGLIALNLGACVTYTWQGLYVKGFYWLCVVGLSGCATRPTKELCINKRFN